MTEPTMLTVEEIEAIPPFSSGTLEWRLKHTVLAVLAELETWKKATEQAAHIHEQVRNQLERLRHTPRKEAVGIPEWISIHNACTDRCDTLHGPCACGSQHDEQWLFEKIAEIVEKARKWKELDRQDGELGDVLDELDWNGLGGRNGAKSVLIGAKQERIKTAQLREALEEIMDYPRYESFSACAMSTLAKAALRGEGKGGDA